VRPSERSHVSFRQLLRTYQRTRVQQLCAMSRHMQCNKQALLFDHVVGSYLQSQWDCKPKCFGGFEVYNEFKLDRLHDR
jgi:hypothetical protein